jgi:hypothetical protein
MRSLLRPRRGPSCAMMAFHGHTLAREANAGISSLRMPHPLKHPSGHASLIAPTPRKSIREAPPAFGWYGLTRITSMRIPDRQQRPPS